MEYSNNCVIYARVSTQDKQDYKRQIDDLQRYAEYKQLKVVKTFGESISGVTSAKERSEFSKMIEYIDDNQIKHVLVTELSRLGRKMRETINIIQDFNDKKVCVHIEKDSLTTLDKNFNENKFTSIIINVLIGFADIERDSITERSISGIRYNVSNQGSGVGIVKPYGYKKVGKKLFVDEDEAAIVRLIFEKYLEGLGGLQIANYLNNKGIKTKYNKIFEDNKTIRTRSGRLKKAKNFVWRDATIMGILKNTIYKGQRNHKGEVFSITPIIDEDTFSKAEAIRKSRFNKKNRNKIFDNIFLEVIKCPKCGLGYWMHKRRDNRDNAYKCSSKRYPDYKCNNVSVNIDKLNNGVYAVLKNSFRLEKNLSILESKKQLLENEKKLIEIDLNQDKNDLQNQKNRQLNLVKSKLDNDIDKEVFTEINTEIFNSINALKKKIAIKEIKLQKIARSNLLMNDAEHKDLANKEMFKQNIKDFIEVIRVHNVSDLVRSGNLAHLYTAKSDVITLVEIKSTLIEDYTMFLTSRQTKFIVKLNLLSIENIDNTIPFLDNEDYQVIELTNDIVIDEK